MLCLVVSENTIQLLLGWEIMGLCSFVLIGHWWEEQPNSNAALKAFFTTRTGDIGLLVGISILFFGADRVQRPGHQHAGRCRPRPRHTVLLWASIALFIAVIGKSGQFPLHTWLPDAMAGPTPVSALIHAATMVVAGVYLVARLYPVFWEGFSIHAGGAEPDGPDRWHHDHHRRRCSRSCRATSRRCSPTPRSASSGYMVMGLGVGAWTAAVFHIFTHAFFKALLFLGAGSISHSGSHHSFDMKKDMGGLRKYMPITFVTFIIGTLALMGVFPLAGFWSKDEIIATAGHNGYTAFMIVGLRRRLPDRGVHDPLHLPHVLRRVPRRPPRGRRRRVRLRAGRARTSTPRSPSWPPARATAPSPSPRRGTVAHEAEAVRHDDPRRTRAHGGAAHGGHDEHVEPHESPLVLTIPLMILSFLAITVGWLNMPWGLITNEKFVEWVEPNDRLPAGRCTPPFSNVAGHHLRRRSW